MQLKEKNLALSRLDRLKDEFIANTTHELCTPLSGIIGIAESMMVGAAGKMSSEALQNLYMMAASGRRLNGLVENILDFSRLKSRDLNLNPRPVDIFGLVAITLKLLTPLAQPKGLMLINEIPENLPPVMADENRLHQVCQILRETHSMSELPVIMLTARTRLQDMVKGFESGANDYLTKPFARDELLARVKIQVKLNRAYKILQENSRLKKEIQRRKRTELDLRMMQQRLSL